MLICWSLSKACCRTNCSTSLMSEVFISVDIRYTPVLPRFVHRYLSEARPDSQSGLLSSTLLTVLCPACFRSLHRDGGSFFGESFCALAFPPFSPPNRPISAICSERSVRSSPLLAP